MTNPFFFTIRVLLTEPVRNADPKDEESKIIIGYYQHFGVRAETLSAAKGILELTVKDGEIDWIKSMPRDFGQLGEDISKQFKPNSS